jgi:F-type H+-transporting ATPase subunit a
MGGGVLVSLLYSALSVASALVIRRLTSNGVIMAVIMLVLGVVIFVLGMKKGKMALKIIGTAFGLIGLVAILEALGVFSGVPILSLGIPAVLSLYFDIFSGGVQALVFSLLTMVYVGDACPPPEEIEANKK